MGRFLRPDSRREIRAIFSCDAAWILGAKSVPTFHVMLPGFWARNQYQLSAGFFRFLWRGRWRTRRSPVKKLADFLAQNLGGVPALAASAWLPDTTFKC